MYSVGLRAEPGTPPLLDEKQETERLYDFLVRVNPGATGINDLANWLNGNPEQHRFYEELVARDPKLSAASRQGIEALAQYRELLTWTFGDRDYGWGVDPARELKKQYELFRKLQKTQAEAKKPMLQIEREARQQTGVAYGQPDLSFEELAQQFPDAVEHYKRLLFRKEFETVRRTVPNPDAKKAFDQWREQMDLRLQELRLTNLRQVLALRANLNRSGTRVKTAPPPGAGALRRWLSETWHRSQGWPSAAFSSALSPVLDTYDEGYEAATKVRSERGVLKEDFQAFTRWPLETPGRALSDVNYGEWPKHELAHLARVPWRNPRTQKLELIPIADLLPQETDRDPLNWTEVGDQNERELLTAFVHEARRRETELAELRKLLHEADRGPEVFSSALKKYTATLQEMTGRVPFLTDRLRGYLSLPAEELTTLDGLMLNGFRQHPSFFTLRDAWAKQRGLPSYVAGIPEAAKKKGAEAKQDKRAYQSHLRNAGRKLGKVLLWTALGIGLGQALPIEQHRGGLWRSLYGDIYKELKKAGWISPTNIHDPNVVQSPRNKGVDEMERNAKEKVFTITLHNGSKEESVPKIFHYWGKSPHAEGLIKSGAHQKVTTGARENAYYSIQFDGKYLPSPNGRPNDQGNLIVYIPSAFESNVIGAKIVSKVTGKEAESANDKIRFDPITHSYLLEFDGRFTPDSYTYEFFYMNMDKKTPTDSRVRVQAKALREQAAHLDKLGFGDLSRVFTELADKGTEVPLEHVLAAVKLTGDYSYWMHSSPGISDDFAEEYARMLNAKRLCVMCDGGNDFYRKDVEDLKARGGVPDSVELHDQTAFVRKAGSLEVTKADGHSRTEVHTVENGVRRVVIHDATPLGTDPRNPEVPQPLTWTQTSQVLAPLIGIPAAWWLWRRLNQRPATKRREPVEGEPEPFFELPPEPKKLDLAEVMRQREKLLTALKPFPREQLGRADLPQTKALALTTALSDFAQGRVSIAEVGRVLERAHPGLASVESADALNDVLSQIYRRQVALQLALEDRLLGEKIAKPELSRQVSAGATALDLFRELTRVDWSLAPTVPSKTTCAPLLTGMTSP